ncbi:MAG TPA: replication-relaxation family protein [Roseiflexaceae bacterium]|nr:replication-relaxation family protein [Roseiflexaceae bacterium]
MTTLYRPRAAVSGLSSVWMAQVLQLLGRLEFTRTRWVHRLLGQEQHRSTTWRQLQLLHQQRLVWSAQLPAERVPGAVGALNRQAPPEAPHVWGITRLGVQWLAEHGIETDPGMLALLQPRDWADPAIALGTIRHDLHTSDHCCAMLAGALRHPHLASVRLAVEYVSARTPEGKERQRFDALLVLCFGERPSPRGSTIIPFDREPPAGAISCRFALEIDMGSEQLSILLGKAAMYRALTLSGHYDQMLGGPVEPIVLVPNPEGRARDRNRGKWVALEWQQGWPDPDRAGLLATFGGAQVGGDGIRGRYLALAGEAGTQRFVLERFGITRAAWEAAISTGGTR